MKMTNNRIYASSAILLLFSTLISVEGTGYLRGQHVGRELPVDDVVVDDLFEGNSFMNSDNNPVDAFLGIQYATYSERFEPSEVLELTTNGSGFVIDATEYGDFCTQVPVPPPFGHELPPSSEDCLYLNIWRPSTAADIQKEDELLPVMVFIHGGAFFFGSGSEVLYNGSNLAGNENVIVVTINYRLGALGFLPTDKEGTGGMNGILDQIQALQWVQNYIHLFGGNPDLVTIWGESAGASSVLALSVIPQAKGLFKRAIVESGEYGRFWSVKESKENLKSAMEQIDCGDKDCTIEDLKTMEASELFGLTSQIHHPTYDSAVLPVDTPTLWAEGKINPTDIIIGTNTYDNSLLLGDPENYINNAKNGITASPEWNAFKLDTLDEERQQAAIDAYSPSKYNGSIVEAVVQFGADATFVCPQRELAQVAAENIDGKVYNYVFGYLSKYDIASDQGILDKANITDNDSWASHGAEAPFVFGNNAILAAPSYESDTPFSKKDKRLSTEMMQRWANFARYGTPFTSDHIGSNKKKDEWTPVVPSLDGNATAADLNYLLFTGNGGTAMQSDKQKMEQCSAIYISPLAT
mgnify:CR=1 FL=1